MLKEIISGIYLNLSFLCASYLLVNSFVSHTYSVTEKLIFAYLTTVANIIVFILILNLFPQGIVSTNIILISQFYFLMSILISIFRKRRFDFDIKSISIKNKITWILIGFFLVNILISFWSIYLIPINEGDTLAYHLQSAPNWYQSRNLTIYPTNDMRNMAFPDNQNFLVLWNFLSFKSDILIGIIPYFYLLFSVLVIFYFLQKLRPNTDLNLAIALLYYFVESHLAYSKTFTGDIGVAALNITSLCLIYSYFKEKKFIYFFFFSVSNGLLLGIKTVGLLDILIIYTFVILCEIFCNKKKSLIKLFVLFSFSLIICFSLGGFQYVRNIIYFHNPFFPKIINILGVINFPGLPGKALGVHGPNIQRMFDTTLILSRDLFNKALGYQFPLFYGPSIFILLLFFRKKIEQFTGLVLLISFFSTILFLFTIAGDSIRYFYPLGFFGITCLVCLINILNDKKLEKGIYLLLSFFVLFAPAGERPLDKLAEVIQLSSKKVEERQLGNIFYDADYHFFRENMPLGINILYILPENSLIYPLYGTHYENRLIYANIDDANIVEETIKKEKIDYFLTKSKTSTYCSIFYWWDLNEGKIIPMSEDKVKEIIASLTENKTIQEIYSGQRVSFYKINKEIYARN